VFDFHKLYSGRNTIDDMAEKCRTAGIGCVECKKIMAANLIEYLAPIREKRVYFKKRPDLVEDIIQTGCDKAREVAKETMAAVRSAMKL